MPRNALIQVRRDTAANWTSTNPTLDAGEIGFETDTNLFKIGNGSSSWSSLAYAAVNASNSVSLSNKTLTSAMETWSVSGTAATGTVNVDIVTASSHYYTANATNNWTFNFRGNSGTALSSLLGVGASVTVAFAVTNGSSAFRPTAFQIDGSSVTPKWQGGVAPTTGSANSIDLYLFTIVKTATTPSYTVFASQTKFA